MKDGKCFFFNWFWRKIGDSDVGKDLEFERGRLRAQRGISNWWYISKDQDSSISLNCETMSASEVPVTSGLWRAMWPLRGNPILILLEDGQTIWTSSFWCSAARSRKKNDFYPFTF